MSKEFKAFFNIKIEKRFNFKNFTIVKIWYVEDVNIDNIKVSSIVSSGEKDKYFVGHKDDGYNI